MKKLCFLLFLFVMQVLNLFAQNLDPLWEIWKYEHGITLEEFINDRGQTNYYVTWSSSAGTPWIHDIFNRIIYFNTSGILETAQEDRRYISDWEAQEPVSTSINSQNNYIFTVFEDGSDSNIPDEAVNVHGQLHLPDGSIIRKNFLIAGGPDAQHSAVSGHIRNKFLAVYVDDNMGDNGISAVKIRVYDDQSGDSLQTLNLTPLTEYHWWPVIESTSNQNRALCVWIEDEENLNASIIYQDADSVTATPHQRIMTGIQFVNHQVNWLEKLSRFVVIAKRLDTNNSKLCLIDTLGNITLQRTVFGAVFQEAKPAAKWDQETASYIYVYPTGENDLNVLQITNDQISLYKKIKGDENAELQPYQWKETGIWSKFVQDTSGNQSWNGQYILLLVMGNYQTDGVHLIPVHIDTDILSAIDTKELISAPADFLLIDNYPNPFNPVTTIQYRLPQSGLVQLSVFDLNGRKTKTLVNEYQQAGVHRIIFSAENRASGIYFARLCFEDKIAVQKMILLQ